MIVPGCLLRKYCVLFTYFNLGRKVARNLTYLRFVTCLHILNTVHGIESLVGDEHIAALTVHVSEPWVISTVMLVSCAYDATIYMHLGNYVDHCVLPQPCLDTLCLLAWQSG